MSENEASSHLTPQIKTVRDQILRGVTGSDLDSLIIEALRTGNEEIITEVREFFATVGSDFNSYLLEKKKEYLRQALLVKPDEELGELYGRAMEAMKKWKSSYDPRDNMGRGGGLYALFTSGHTISQSGLETIAPLLDEDVREKIETNLRIVVNVVPAVVDGKVRYTIKEIAGHSSTETKFYVKDNLDGDTARIYATTEIIDTELLPKEGRGWSMLKQQRTCKNLILSDWIMEQGHNRASVMNDNVELENGRIVVYARDHEDLTKILQKFGGSYKYHLGGNNALHVRLESALYQAGESFEKYKTRELEQENIEVLGAEIDMIASD